MYDEAMKRLDEEFGNKDGLISLSTIALQKNAEGGSRPAARLVNAFYENGAFYTVTYATSTKMQQIAKNPEVAICIIVEKFTADGIGENLGWVCDDKNAEIMAKVRPIFAAWYNDANNDEDPNTCLLRVRLTKGMWYDAHTGARTVVDFASKKVVLLSSSSSYQTVDLPGENRTGVMEIANPGGWSVVHYDMGAYKNQRVTIKFSADVKRVGAAGALRWQINNGDYPSVGNAIENAPTDTWHKMAGEWTGTLAADLPAMFLSTHENNSSSTAYYVDNFTVTVTPAP